jgi:Uma2 family endonuclease
MVHSPRPHFTFEEYVERAEDSGIKLEFRDGEIWAMSGGSLAHARIAANLARLLGNAVAGRACAVFSSDLRVRVRATGLATYPDVTVICGPAELDAEDHRGESATNPTVLVEVLSPSTEDYDRGLKLGDYKLIPSLREVLLVAHDRREIELVRREPDGTWSRHIFRERDAVRLVALECELSVTAIYADPVAKPLA